MNIRSDSTKAKIAVIGAGFSGLSSALYLVQNGFKVTVFESGERGGGLASGFKKVGWDWYLENYYHHFFLSDKYVLRLAENVGQKIDFKAPRSSTFLKSGIYHLDSPVSLLRFNKIGFCERIRTGVVIAFLKANPFWMPLENLTSYEFLPKYMGKNSWEIIWKPLFVKKFDKYAQLVNAAWFWARIKKRSAMLGYPEGGFYAFVKKIENKIKDNGGTFFYNRSVTNIKNIKEKIKVSTGGKDYIYDKVICTLPLKTFIKITEDLPKDYISQMKKFKSVGAVNLVISLKERFLCDGSYWLNVNDMDFPFIALVEHTNFMDKKHYGNDHLLYIANYLPPGNRYFKMTAGELLQEFEPYLKKINKDFKVKKVKNAWVFGAKYAQPVAEVGRSNVVPPYQTPIDNLYLCNMEQIYPWDRGTNYAVEQGKKVAELVIKSK